MTTYDTIRTDNLNCRFFPHFFAETTSIPPFIVRLPSRSCETAMESASKRNA